MAKIKPTRPAAPSARWSILRKKILLHAFAVVVLAGALLTAVWLARDGVEKHYSFPPLPPRIVLVDRPLWMSDSLAREIIDTARPTGAHSAFDHQLLVDTAKALQSNPWVKEVVQVRRAYSQRPADTLEIRCNYRVPTALVKWGDYFWLVDGDGYKLPEQYTRQQLDKVMTGSDGKLSLRIIQGVNRPPVESGRLWQGDDLAAGLEMVKLLAGRNYAEEIPIVDVSNFGGRVDNQSSQLVLQTRYGSSIRWGRAPSAKDYFIEVPTSQKLQILADIFDQMHRIDAGQPWIDIRFDKVTYPSPDPHSVHADDR